MHTSQGTAAAKIGRLNYFETSFDVACTMVTRSVVTILLVSLFTVSDGKRNFEETFRKCQENFECVHRSVCENYNRRLAEYRTNNNSEILVVVVGWGKTDPDQLSLSKDGVYSNDQLKLKVSYCFLSYIKSCVCLYVKVTSPDNLSPVIVLDI